MTNFSGVKPLKRKMACLVFLFLFSLWTSLCITREGRGLSSFIE
jgi:hypothetical protein